MEHEPCGLLRDANILRQLARADALLVRGHQKDSHEPLAQPDLAILENRAVADRKLLQALEALMRVVLERLGLADYATVRAYGLVRIGPAKGAEVIDAGILVREGSGHVGEAFELGKYGRLLTVILV